MNFGDVRIPRGFDYPKPQKLGTLSGVHGVSSEPIVVVDAQTLLIPSFSYDGEAPGEYSNVQLRYANGARVTRDKEFTMNLLYGST